MPYGIRVVPNSQIGAKFRPIVPSTNIQLTGKPLPLLPFVVGYDKMEMASPLVTRGPVFARRDCENFHSTVGVSGEPSSHTISGHGVVSGGICLPPIQGCVRDRVAMR